MTVGYLDPLSSKGLYKKVTMRGDSNNNVSNAEIRYSEPYGIVTGKATEE